LRPNPRRRQQARGVPLWAVVAAILAVQAAVLVFVARAAGVL